MPRPNLEDYYTKPIGAVIVTDANGESWKVVVGPDGKGKDVVPVAANATVANSGTPTQLDATKTTTQRLQDERQQLLTANNAQGTTADARAKNTERIQAIDKDLEVLGKPAVVGKGSSVITGYDANGKPIMSDQTAFPLPAGASVAQIGPDGKPTFTQAPVKAQPARVDSPAETKSAQANMTSAQANMTSAQANMIREKIAALAADHSMAEADKKAAFDTWFKVNIEEPRAEQNQAITAQEYANKQGQTAVDDAKFKAMTDASAAPDVQAAIGNAAGNKAVGSYAAPTTLPQYGDPAAIRRAAVMNALKDISPTANAIYGAGAGGLNVPAPTSLPGSTPAPATSAAAVAGLNPDGTSAAPANGVPTGVDPAIWAAFQKYQQRPAAAAAA